MILRGRAAMLKASTPALRVASERARIVVRKTTEPSGRRARARWSVDRGAGEDHEDAQAFVGGELVVRVRRDEDRLSLHDRYRLTLDVEDAAAFEDDVQLVVLVRLLVVRLRSDKDVDADLEAGRGVHDLVP